MRSPHLGPVPTRAAERRALRHPQHQQRHVVVVALVAAPRREVTPHPRRHLLSAVCLPRPVGRRRREAGEPKQLALRRSWGEVRAHGGRRRWWPKLRLGARGLWRASTPPQYTRAGYPAGRSVGGHRRPPLGGKRAPRHCAPPQGASARHRVGANGLQRAPGVCILQGHPGGSCPRLSSTR